MKLLTSLAAGFAGSFALTALHETARRLHPQDAPRMDLVGERGLRKLLALDDLPQPSHEVAYSATLLGDVLTNGFVYALVGTSSRPVPLGAALGALTGAAGVLLPGPLGLGAAPTRRTPQTQAMTITWYLLGGLVAGAVAQALRESDQAA